MENITDDIGKEQGFIFTKQHNRGTSVRFALLWVLSIILFLSALLFPVGVLDIIPKTNSGGIQIFSISLVALCLGGIMALVYSAEKAEATFIKSEKERFYEWLEERYHVGFEPREANTLFERKSVVRTGDISKNFYIIRQDDTSGFYYLFYENEVALKQSLAERIENDKKLNREQRFFRDEALKLKLSHTPKLPSTPPPKPTPPSGEEKDILTPPISTALVLAPSMKTKMLVKFKPFK